MNLSAQALSGREAAREADGADYLDTLARFACETRLADLDAHVRARGRWIIADSIGAIAAGMQVEEMQALCAAQLAHAATGPAWVIGTRVRTNRFDAALLNGSAGTWLELDEGNHYAKGHPGIQVVPAALAAAQAFGASGADLLLAVMLGYEICSRISRASQVRLNVHPHGTFGVIGAAVAVGRLQDLAPPAMRTLLNIAATLGLATSRNALLEGATVRNLYTGHAGAMGQMAVRLAQAGFTGERDGVATIYGKVLSEGFDPARALDGLGREWLATAGYFKLHCTGRYVHSAIDALEDALARAGLNGLAPARVAAVEVRTYLLGAMLSGQHITTTFGARFSIPFALATILHHGRSDLAAFSAHAVADPDVQALCRRITVLEDPEHTRAYPHRQRCDLHIRLDDGTTLEGHCDIMKGEPERPHADAQLEDKFLTLGGAVWGRTATKRLFDDLMSLESVDNMRNLRDPFHA